MPNHVTASTGFDAFTHAFERYIQPQYHPFVDMTAENVIATVFECLPRVLADPQDIELRCRMSWGGHPGRSMRQRSTWGGRPAYTLSLPISAVKDAPHGVTLAIMLPVVLADIAPMFPRQAARIAELLGADPTGLSDQEVAALCQKAMQTWLEEIGMAYYLSDLGCNEGDCREMAAVVNMERLRASYQLQLDEAAILERYLSRL